jgi:AcrR family transcriptional regulator
MREIAEACDMPIGTIYRYIGSKDDILYFVINELATRTKDFREEARNKLDSISATEALEWALEWFCHAIAEVEDILLFSWQEMQHLKPEHRRSILNNEADLVAMFEEILSKGCETGEFKVHNKSVVADNIVVLGETWALRRWLLKDKASHNEFIEQQIKFIMHGIRADSSGKQNTSQNPEKRKKEIL